LVRSPPIRLARCQPAAVVAHVEDQLGGAGVAQGGERLVEGGHRRLHEISEDEVADLAAVHFVELRHLHGRNGDDALRQRRLPVRPLERTPLDDDGDPFFVRPERRRDLVGGGDVGHGAAVHRQEAVAALQAGLGRRAVREHFRDAHLDPVEGRRHPEADELAGRIEGVLIGAAGDEGIGRVERLVADRLEIGLRRRERGWVQRRQLAIPVVVLDQGVAHEPVLGRHGAGRLRLGRAGRPHTRRKG
jgi:hypothetical protein